MATELFEAFNTIQPEEPTVSFYEKPVPKERHNKKDFSAPKVDDDLAQSLFSVLIGLSGRNLNSFATDFQTGQSSASSTPVHSSVQRKRAFDPSKYIHGDVVFDEAQFSNPKRHRQAARAHNNNTDYHGSDEEVIVISDDDSDDYDNSSNDCYTTNNSSKQYLSTHGTSAEPIVVDDDDDNRGVFNQSTVSSGLHSNANADVEKFITQQGSLRETLGVLNTDSIFEYAVDDLLQRESAVLDIAVPTNLHASHGDWRYSRTDSDGDKLLAKLKLGADLFPKKRSFLQRKLHALAWNVFAGVIFDKEWYSSRESIMRRYGWKDLLPVAASICPRRYGKTVGTAMLAADFLLCMPSIQIACFAPTLRQAVNLLQAICDEVKDHPWFKNFAVISRNQVELKIMGPDGTVRHVTAYPSLHTVRAFLYIHCFFTKKNHILHTPARTLVRTIFFLLNWILNATFDFFTKMYNP